MRECVSLLTILNTAQKTRLFDRIVDLISLYVMNHAEYNSYRSFESIMHCEELLGLIRRECVAIN